MGYDGFISLQNKSALAKYLDACKKGDSYGKEAYADRAGCIFNDDDSLDILHIDGRMRDFFDEYCFIGSEKSMNDKGSAVFISGDSYQSMDDVGHPQKLNIAKLNTLPLLWRDFTESSGFIPLQDAQDTQGWKDIRNYIMASRMCSDTDDGYDAWNNILNGVVRIEETDEYTDADAIQGNIRHRTVKTIDTSRSLAVKSMIAEIIDTDIHNAGLAYSLKKAFYEDGTQAIAFLDIMKDIAYVCAMCDITELVFTESW